MSAETGAIIKAYRQEFGLTQMQFSERLGISRSALTQLEADNTRPSYEVMERMLTEFSVDPTVFFVKNDDASMERRNTAELDRLANFWSDHYSGAYDHKDFLDALMRLEKLIDSKKDKSGLRDIYSLYSSLSDLVDEMELYFIDPLKRYSLQLDELRNVPVEERDTDDFRLKEHSLRNMLNYLADSAADYWRENGERYAAVQDPIGNDNAQIFDTMPGCDPFLMKYSQEKYLRAFFVLLGRSEELVNVAECHENSDKLRALKDL